MDKPSFLIHFDDQGRVVIPDWLRALCDIHEGAEFHVWVEGDKVMLKPVRVEGPAVEAPAEPPE